jgi:hypothetical protein
VNQEDFPDPAVIIAAALLLMTRFAVTPCPFLLEMVIHQLEFLARHPSERLSPILRDISKKLVRDWEHLLQHETGPYLSRN